MIKSIPALPAINITCSAELYKLKFGFSDASHDEGFAKLIRDEVEIHLSLPVMYHGKTTETL